MRRAALRFLPFTLLAHPHPPRLRRQRHRTAGLEGSWATICVVGEKSKPRETASGGLNDYVIAQLGAPPGQECLQVGLQRLGRLRCC